MGRTAKALLVSGCCLHLMGSAVVARAEEAGDEDHTAWTTYADCAAGYLANWQDRLSNPERSRDMSNMIRAQSDEYKAAAARAHRAQTKSGEEEATRAADDYVRDNLSRFIAMDKAGQLEAFIDECPQADDSAQD